jgi:hypothetical protein
VRHGVEAALGTDLSAVRLHADRQAARAAAQLDAAAFTLGSDIWFGAGRLDTGSEAGRALLGHELVHVAEHSRLGRIHRQPARATTPARRATGPGSRADPVVLMEASRSSGAAVLTTRSGARIEGHMDDLDLDPGSYWLTTNYAAGTWTISGTDAGLRFTLSIPDPATATEDPPGLIDPFSLTYDHLSLRVTQAGGAQAQEVTVDLDATFRTMAMLLDRVYVSGADEEVLIGLIEEVPASQSAEFLRRLAQPRRSGQSWLDDLDDRITGHNNERLHEALSTQHLRVAPEKSVAALLTAPVLPWHDVMGFFEDAATFTAARAGPGKVRVRYLGGTRLITSKDFGNEIAMLPREIFIGGVTYDDDQPLVIHDYDSGRFVTLVAGELAGYEHLGVRNFLGHVATVASFAIPVSAASTVAGKIAVVALERVLPAVFLLVDENRLNLVKWFPNWGPQMIRYSDTLKTFAAAVGFARLAVSGFQIFKQWREVSRSRGAIETAAQLDAEARRVAAALEHDAEEAYTRAEQVRTAEAATSPQQGPGTTAAPGAPTAAGTPAAGPAAPPAPAAPSAELHAPASATGEPPASAPAAPGTGASPASAAPATGTAAATAAHTWEGINDETRTFLGSNPKVRAALEHSPLAAEALKACASLCYPRFVTEPQIARLEEALEQAERVDIAVNTREIQRALKAAQNPADLDAVIGQVEQGVRSRISRRELMLEEQRRGARVEPPEGTHAVGTTPNPRTRAGVSDAEVLAGELERDLGPRPPGHHAHHIVPKGMADAEEAWDILERAHIGINDAQNGVWLPKDFTVVNPATGEIHATIHTRRYIRWVTSELRKAIEEGGASRVEAKLAELRRIIMDGRAIR